MASNLIPELPEDTEVWEEIDDNGISSYYLVYQLPPSAQQLASGLQDFTWRYKVTNLDQITQGGQQTVQPDYTVRRSGDVLTEVKGVTNIGRAKYNGSFYFGTHTQLAAIRGQVEDGATGYDYFVEALEQESKYKPYLLSQNSSGEYDYLGTVIEAALEGRTVREAELQDTAWYQSKSISEQVAMVNANKDPRQFARDLITSQESITQKMVEAGIATLDPKVIDTLTNNLMYGTFTNDDVDKAIAKLANPRLRYSLDPQVKAALEGKTLDVIEQTVQLENTINAYLGPGQAEFYDVDSLQQEREANPVWFNQTFLPQLKDQFQATYTQYKGTNVNMYETAAANYRQDWQGITGQAPDETTPQWKQFMATNDVEERRDIAFAESARLGTQTYRDNLKTDLQSKFGRAGQRATGGGRFQ